MLTNNLCASTDRSVLLTFDLQVDVVLVGAQGVAGHAGVLPTVEGLRHVELQGPVVVDHVRLPVQGAGAAVFEPESQAGQGSLSLCTSGRGVSPTPVGQSLNQ